MILKKPLLLFHIYRHLIWTLMKRADGSFQISVGVSPTGFAFLAIAGGEATAGQRWKLTSGF